MGNLGLSNQNKTMSKEFYRKRLIDLRAELAREKEAKKRDNEKYASYIKNATSVATKASYRKSKVSASASHDRRIESLKKEIERNKESLKREK